MRRLLFLIVPLLFSTGAEGRQRAVLESDVLKAAQKCGVNWQIEVDRAVGDTKTFWWRTKPGALTVTIEPSNRNKAVPVQKNRDFQGCLDRWAKRRGVSVHTDLGLVVY